MAIENKRKADESALVPVTKKSKNEVAVASNKKALVQSVSLKFTLTLLLYTTI